DRVERCEHPLHRLRPPARIGGHKRRALLTEVQQNRPALEDGDVPVREPRHLSERLLSEMHGLAPLERGRRHAISKPRLLQRPAYAEVAHKAPRRLRNPVESRQHQIAHRHLLSGPSRARGPTTRLTTNLEPPLPVRRLPLRVDLSRPIVGARTAGRQRALDGLWGFGAGAAVVGEGFAKIAERRAPLMTAESSLLRRWMA